MTANTITLNGKVYDSKTGSLIGGHTARKTPVKKAVAEYHTESVKVPTYHKHSSQSHTPAAHKTAHKTQKTKTLMRNMVKRPVIAVSQISPDKQATAHNKTTSLLLPQLSENRLKRAHEVHKSKLITRFGVFGSQPTFIKKTTHLPVKQHPSSQISHHEDQPVIAEPPAVDIFTSGLQQATSHLQTRSKHQHAASKRTKKARKSLVTGVLAITLLAGFFAYQSKPNMEFRVAAARSGVHASLPGYHPSGFAMKGPIEYAPGQLTMRFQSNSDDRNFTISQKVSSWNSTALLDNYVAGTDSDYQTVQDKGRTIYLYGDSNATWVDGGVWYQIEGASSLSSTQLVKIVNSI